MRTRFTRAALLTLAAAAWSGPATAAPIVANQWYSFLFGSAGTSIEGGGVPGVLSIPAPDAPWEITLTQPGQLLVVDGFQSGDQFEILDFGAVIGMTSVPALGGICDDDELACLADADFSRGVFPLATGGHSFTGAPILSPFDGGTAFFIVNLAQLPEPASLAILGFGAAGLALARRRSGGGRRSA